MALTSPRQPLFLLLFGAMVAGTFASASSLSWAQGQGAAPTVPAAPPAPSPRLTASAETLEHRIALGDTLIGLHRRLMRPEADWRVVQRLNRVADPRRLQPGRTLRIPVSFLRGEPVAAEVVHTHGQVTLRRGAEAARPLVSADALREGDVVETGARSSLSIRFVDGALTLVGPDSRMEVVRHRAWPQASAEASAASSPASDATRRAGLTELNLQRGATETDLPPAAPGTAGTPRFELRTPVVNFGVRGTRFRARVDAGAAWGEVERGRVALGPLLLLPGQGARADGQAAPRARPLLGPPDAPPGPERLERLPLQWSWTGPAEAQGWRVQVLEALAPVPVSGSAPASGAEIRTPPFGLVHDVRVDTPSLSVADLPDGPYELRLRAIDADGLEGRERRVPFVVKVRPEPPLRVSPAAGSVWTTERVPLAWSRHPQAERYRLEVLRLESDGTRTPVLARDDLVDPQIDLTLPVGRYLWRLATVRAGDDRGPWSDFEGFERQPPPPPPPAPAAEPPNAGRDGLQLRWASSSAPQARYQVQVARDEAFTALVADETLQDTAWRLAEPPSGRLHVRVRAFDAQGAVGPWGTTQTVDVPQRWEWWWLLPLLLLI